MQFMFRKDFRIFSLRNNDGYEPFYDKLSDPGVFPPSYTCCSVIDHVPLLCEFIFFREMTMRPCKPSVRYRSMLVVNQKL